MIIVIIFHITFFFIGSGSIGSNGSSGQNSMNREDVNIANSKMIRHNNGNATSVGNQGPSGISTNISGTNGSSGVINSNTTDKSTSGSRLASSSHANTRIIGGRKIRKA